MTKPLVLLLLILPFISIAQRQTDEVTFTKRTVGKNLVTGQPILAKEYFFGDRIYNVAVDTQLQLLSIQLRGLSRNGKWMDNSGDYVLYDLEKRELKWRKRIVYDVSDIEKFDKYILEIKQNRSHLLSLETGERLWSTKSKIYFADPKLEIGIAYKFSSWSGPTNMLEGIDLRTGNDIWSRDIDRDYSWNDLLYLNDSTLLIAASGLHSLNLRTGRGWDYKTVTGEKDYTLAAVSTAAGAVLGVLTGAFVMSTAPNLVRDVVSNVLLDDKYIYFASRERLAKLDRQGRVIWSVPLASASKSTIFIKTGKVYMVNHGFAFMGQRQLQYGKPFIAAFDSATGKEIFTRHFEKGNAIKDFKLGDDVLALVLNDAVVTASAANGKIYGEYRFDDETQGKPAFFIGQHIFLADNGNYSALVTDTTKYFVYTDNKVVVLSDRLEVVEEMGTTDLWVCYAIVQGKRFLSKEGTTVVIDNKNHSIAKFNATHKSKIINTSLYNIYNNSFSEIDISSILAN